MRITKKWLRAIRFKNKNDKYVNKMPYGTRAL